MGSTLQILAPIAVAVIGALAWLLRRKLTTESAAERYELAAKMLDVRSKLAAAGFDVEQVRSFVTALENDSTGQRTSSALKAITPGAPVGNEGSEPEAFQTTAAMGARVFARLNVLDAEIERAPLDVEILANQHFAESGAHPIRYDSSHVRKMHRTWKLFRRRAAISAAEDYIGGTMSTVIYLLEEVRLAEEFLKYLNDRISQLARR